MAGRINLNYQIMPFTNIRRATALHAVLKGEFMTAIPLNDDVNKSKEFINRGGSNRSDWTGGKGDYTWGESGTGDKKFWHRPINVNATLGQFDLKFKFGATSSSHSPLVYNGLFRTASQICEMHLIPDISGGISVGESGTSSLNAIKPSQSDDPLTAQISPLTTVETQMSTFWQSHASTGDNTRERPYANIYPRVTTRSNTFRVHVRAQMIRKARSVAVNTFDPDKDAVVSEYRGSSVVERFIDPNSTENPLPDYGASPNPQSLIPLEAFYRFRTLESKRFSP